MRIKNLTKIASEKTKKSNKSIDKPKLKKNKLNAESYHQK